MRIHIKLIIQTCILILVAIVIFSVYVRVEFEQNTILFQSQKKDIEDTFNKILDLKSKPLETLALDYSYWDELVSYVKKPNKVWAEQYLKTAISTYDVDLMLVYDRGFSMVYHVSTAGNEALYGQFSQKVALPEVFMQKRVNHFFIYVVEGVLEVCGASIHPTNDPLRKGEPQGFLFVAKLWSKGYIDEISRITDCRLDIIYPFSKTTFINNFQYRDEAIQFSKILRDWGNSPVARVDVAKISQSVIESKFMSRLEIILIVFFILFVALVYIWFIIRQVYRPLVLISRALKEHNLQHILKMQSGSNEFAEIARLIFKFSENKIELAKEVNLLKITENQLEKERDRVQEYLDIAGVMLVILDKEGNISMINKKGCAILGYEEREIMGKNWFQTCLLQENKEEVSGVFRKIISGDEDFKEYYENQVLRKDGVLRMVAFHNAILRGKDSKIIGILFSGEDITERKQIEKDLHKISRELQVIIDSSQSMIYYKDKENRFIFVNKAFAEISGLPKESIEGRTAFELFPEYADKYWQDDLSVINTNLPKLDIYESLITKNGVLWLKTDKIPYKDEHGNIIGVIGFSLDVTLQKQAEEALLESEEKYRSIVNNIGIGIALISPDMEILSLNSQMRQWYPGIDLKQKHICYCCFNNPPAKEICSYCPTVKTLKDGQVHESVTETPMGDKIFNYRIISSPVRGKNGKIVAAIEMVEDITESRRAEKALRESEERYRVLFNGSHDALMTLDPPGFKFTSGNVAAIELFGIKDMAEFTTLCPWDISPEIQPDGKASVVKAKEMLEIAISKGSSYFEWTHKRPNGEEFLCLVLLSVFTFSGKKIVQASVRDITETKKIEDELKRKTEFLEAQKEASLDGLLVVDEYGKRVLANKRLIELWKIPQEIVEDENDEALLQYVVEKAKDPQQFLDKVNYLYAHRDEKSRDEIEFKDGMVFDRYSSPVIDKNGKYFGRIWTFRDITELKQAEQELKKDLHDLEVFYKASLGREERILELKKHIRELEQRLGNVK
ncbi:MAG: PAS domain S-box protein [Candidatus Omnitrophica bacterium]|nr:PAS domain S-box protein [Candidatus Omnitrophota bacterium]